MAQHPYRFLLATAAWGEPARSNYFKFHLPSLNFPGNLEALGDDVVTMTYNEKNSIIHEGSGSLSISKTMIGMQQRAAEYAFQEDRILIWTYPDTIVLPHSFAEFTSHLDRGYRALMYPGVTCQLPERHLRYLLRHWENSEYLENRSQMWSLLNNFLHPTSAGKILNTDDPRFFKIGSSWPHIVYTKTENEFWANAFHSSPIFVWQHQNGSICKTPLDGDFLMHAGLKKDDIQHWPINYANFEFADSSKTEGLQTSFSCYKDWFDWTKIHVTDFNLATARHGILIGQRNSALTKEQDGSIYEFFRYVQERTLKIREEEGLKCVTS